ncbi:hypothetical protein GNP82_18930 [Aliivibrio fischeri]|uniref:abortive infection system antitoxin AbiGi family protein n=1 Tax=Aliivibrio fischeri TaxID=668 RepID=UPI0012D87021|nr:abortive infection system antitoxin AbiGi family protein [Aliivibrio fischeri]MUK39613.1 hypothetical protein [Aliivibrio fischeri]MUL08183.1 hypothetical protein [Aliivibrio fischeri]
MNKFTQDDQSDFLIHLVGKDESYTTFMNILSQGRIKSINAFGFNRMKHGKLSICFSEIPPVFIKKLVKRRANYGIAFKKSWLQEKGAQRIWYIEKNSKLHSSLVNISNELSVLIQDEFNNLAPFIDVSGDYGTSSYRFEWEREWRLIGDLSFTPDDVEFLILPGKDHDAAREFFADAELDGIGPNYNCPYYDPTTDYLCE